MYRRGETSARTRSGRAKMSRAPQARGSASAASSARPEPRSHTAPVTMTVTWMSGSEPWARIECRGQTYYRPGQMRLFELLLWLNGWGS